jgi:NRPS condensation-like uncharacterized protein
MKSRELEPGELVIDTMQRTSPMTFTVVARVSGQLSEAMLERALRMLERRHPLLRARIVRGDGPARFEFGTGAPIPLRCERAPMDAWLSETERSLTRGWNGDGPRAALTWLQHDAKRSTLLFTGDHVTADGMSGMIAVRDLLRFAHAADDAVVVRASPGQAGLLPPDLGSLKSRLRGIRYLVSAALAGSSDRPRLPGPFPVEGRQARVQRFVLERAASDQLAARAKREGCTVHGVLGAAMAIAVAQACDRDMRQRIFHPIDLRFYGKQMNPNAISVADAYGYYVSVAETVHDVRRNASIAELAPAITEAVRAKKASGEPLISGPVAGGILTKAASMMSPQRFCNLAENALFRAAFAMTHVGRIEALDIEHDVGPFHIDELFATTLSSLATPLTIGGMLWGERIVVTVSSVEPLIPFDLAREIVRRGREHVEAYARVDARAQVSV